MATFTYEFEELPLVISNGIPAALINGCAEIGFARNGDWNVRSVAVEGYQDITKEERASGKKPWIYVAAPDELAAIIEDRLYGEWNAKVQDAINEAMIEQREAAAEARADARRDDRMMGV